MHVKFLSQSETFDPFLARAEKNCQRRGRSAFCLPVRVFQPDMSHDHQWKTLIGLKVAIRSHPPTMCLSSSTLDVNKWQMHGISFAKISHLDVFKVLLGIFASLPEATLVFDQISCRSVPKSSDRKRFQPCWVVNQTMSMLC